MVLAACSVIGGTEPAATVGTTREPTTRAPSSFGPTSAAPSTTAPEGTTGAGRLGFVGDPTAVGIGDDYFPTLGNPGYDVDHYTLDLVFDPVSVRLDGIATLTVTASDRLETFNLDFSGLTIDDVTVDDGAAAFEIVEEDVVITPPSPIAPGEEFTVEIEYGGRPQPASSAAVPFGVGWTTFDAQHYVVAEPDAAHTWFPSNDHPIDKATYTFRITVPSDVIAAANGVLTDQLTDLGSTTWVWEMAQPMASYLATVVIGNFAIVEDAAASAVAGIPIRHVLPTGTTIADWPGLERQGEMLAHLASLFGPYPFDTYGIAIVEGFGAALENQTLALFDRNVATSAFFEDVLVHEIAHQWFGNSVSPGRWQDIWLNEGFASYAEWLWIERERGRDEVEAGIAAERDQFADSGFPPVGSPPVFTLFNAAVYRVGAMTLHALRLTVGDDTFFEILRTYASDFAGASAVTADFVAVAEAVSGMQLQPLLDSWLADRELPQLP